MTFSSHCESTHLPAVGSYNALVCIIMMPLFLSVIGQENKGPMKMYQPILKPFHNAMQACCALNVMNYLFSGLNTNSNFTVQFVVLQFTTEYSVWMTTGRGLPKKRLTHPSQRAFNNVWHSVMNQQPRLIKII